MITTCTECQARYQLDNEKIPPRVIKVRCPACSGVFSLDGTQAAKQEPVASDEPLVTSGYESVSAPRAETPAPAAARPAAKPAPATANRADNPAAAPQTATSGVAVLDAPQQTPPARSPRRRRSKEEMLARALVSDIKVYNRELYDKAKADGNLLEALGAEIKKSWELYKEKVTPEVANGSEHFREALNEILADGEKVF